MTPPRKARTWQILNPRDLVLAASLVNLGYADETVAKWIRNERRYLSSEKIETIRLAIAAATRATSRSKTARLH